MRREGWSARCNQGILLWGGGVLFRSEVKRGQCVNMSRAELQTRGIVSENVLNREKARLG